jgi:hypothetical protein
VRCGFCTGLCSTVRASGPVAKATMLLGFVLGLAACSTPTGPVEPDLQGGWTGSVSQPEVHLDVTLVRRGQGRVLRFEGSGTLWGAGPRVDLAVTGTATNDSIALDLTPPGYVPIRFAAAVSDGATRLVGTLDGSGITSLPFVLERQP